MDRDDLLSFSVPECDRPYAFWLVSVPWIGQGPVPKLLDIFGSPRAVYECSDKELMAGVGDKIRIDTLLEFRKKYDIFERYDEFMRSGMKLSFVWDDDYPQRLGYIPDPPIALFYYGRLPENDKLSVAVIGSRQCSRYGAHLAEELGRSLGENDINVISGMATGIDGISQSSAADAGGASYAVLGSGADVCYPGSNRPLYEKLKERGGIISVYPPHTPAEARFFPPRNRIVSGLADAVVVLEARSRSGTLITVDMALDQGRDIYAAPGRLGDELSAGCNGLIGHGARVYLSPEIFMKDIFEDHYETVVSGKAGASLPGCGIRKEKASGADMRHRNYGTDAEKVPDLEEGSMNVYRMLTYYPQSAEDIDEAFRRTGADSPGGIGISLILIELCIMELAIQVSPGYFCRK
ncbi:MAG: DNA-processing protein DprA [Lachnospiraceae bacterium]|nr:DNA-processing protein DprA [Lachnospiraceae bacterium]